MAILQRAWRARAKAREALLGQRFVEAAAHAREAQLLCRSRGGAALSELAEWLVEKDACDFAGGGTG